MEKDQLEAISKELDEYNKESTIEEIKNFHKLIVEDADEKFMIYEHIFRQHFLPHFVKAFNASTKREDINQVVFLEWIDLIGGPFKEATVVDLEGNKIIDIPSVYIRPETTKEITDIDFDKVTTKYELEKNRLAVAGTRYLNSVFSGININLGDAEAEHKLRWVNVFKFFYPNQEKKPRSKEFMEGIKLISGDSIGDDELDLDY